MKKLIGMRLLIALVSVALIFTVTFKAQAQSDKLPAPDFSEMEKDYEIVKWTYTDDGNIKLIIKAKNDPPQLHHKYSMRFYDADGIDIVGPYDICCPGYTAAKGETQRAETFAPDESKLKNLKAVIVYRVLDDGTLVGPKFDAAKTNETSNKSGGGTTSRNAQNTTAAKSDQSATGCNYDTLPVLTAATKFSETAAKSAIYERYGFEKDTGGLSSPLALGVTFINLNLLDSYTNSVTVVPGRGAQRKHDGAPVGATVYRFHAKYIVCRKYSDSTRRTQYENDNVCFKAKNGNWDCPVDSVPQITELN